MALIQRADKRHLAELRRQIADFLVDLRLRLHPKKQTILPVTQGIRFLGYRVFPTHKLLAADNVRRFRRRFKDMQAEVRAGVLSEADMQHRVRSWIGHAQQADTFRLRAAVFA